MITLETIVYLKTDTEQKGMVTGILTRPGGMRIFYVVWSHDMTERGHFEIELTTEQNYS